MRASAAASFCPREADPVRARYLSAAAHIFQQLGPGLITGAAFAPDGGRTSGGVFAPNGGRFLSADRRVSLPVFPKSGQREVMVSALQLVFARGIYIPPEVLSRDKPAARDPDKTSRAAGRPWISPFSAYAASRSGC
jgi:hypothetical protein